MTSTTETVSRDGSGPELLVRHWPAVGPAWAAMLIVHGLAEHSGRYEHVGDGFAAAGIEVPGTRPARQRRVGRTAGLRGSLVGLPRRRGVAARGRPRRGRRASRSCCSATRSAAWSPRLRAPAAGRPPTCSCCRAPALDSTIPGWKKAMARALSGVAPTMPIKNELDRRPAVDAIRPSASAYFADPLVERTTTTRLARRGARLGGAGRRGGSASPRDPDARLPRRRRPDRARRRERAPRRGPGRPAGRLPGPPPRDASTSRPGPRSWPNRRLAA